jgi:hypothetical protein
MLDDNHLNNVVLDVKLLTIKAANVNKVVINDFCTENLITIIIIALIIAKK